MGEPTSAGVEPQGSVILEIPLPQTSSPPAALIDGCEVSREFTAIIRFCLRIKNGSPIKGTVFFTCKQGPAPAMIYFSITQFMAATSSRAVYKVGRYGLRSLADLAESTTMSMESLWMV